MLERTRATGDQGRANSQLGLSAEPEVAAASTHVDVGAVASDLAVLREVPDTEIPQPTKERMHVIAGDANTEVPLLLDSEQIDRSKACFCFVDPDSTQIDWATIEALAGYKTPGPDPKDCKVELWILLNLHQAVQRLWPKNRPKTGDNPNEATLDRIMGGRAAWADLWRDGKQSTHLLHRYRDRLEIELCYTYVIPQLIRDPNIGRPQYHMIHASDHVAAVSFMRFAKRRASAGRATDPMF